MHSDTSFRGKTIEVFSKLLYHARLTSADASNSIAEDVVNDLIGACLEEKKTRDALKSTMPIGKGTDYPWTTQMIQAYTNYIDAATAHDHKRVDSMNSYIVNELKRMEDKARGYAIGSVESTTYSQQPGYNEMLHTDTIKFHKLTYAHDELETDKPWVLKGINGLPA